MLTKYIINTSVQVQTEEHSISFGVEHNHRCRKLKTMLFSMYCVQVCFQAKNIYLGK